MAQRWAYKNAVPVPINRNRNINESMIVNDLEVDTIRVVGTATLKNLHVTTSFVCDGTTVLNGSTTVNGIATFTSLTNLSNVIVHGTMSCFQNVYMSNNLIINNNLSVNNYAYINNANINTLSSNGTTTYTLSVSNATTLNTLSVLNNTTLNHVNVVSTLSVQGNIRTNSRFQTSVGYVDPEVGDIKMNVTSTERNGWLLCNGRAVSRSTYAALFALIGTTFGSGDNVNTFNLPDTSGRVLGNSGGGYTTGTSTGSYTTTLTASNLPGHTHSGTTNVEGSHTHSINDPGHTHQQVTVNDDFNNSGGNTPSFAADSAGTRTWNNITTNTTGITINTNGSHSHTFTTDTGLGLNASAFSNIQPTLFIGYTFIFGGVA
jgi:microcystin-dependent protein